MQRAIGEGLREMRAADDRAAVEIGDGARDLEDAVIATRRKPHRVGGVTQEFHAGGIGRRDRVENGAACFGIDAKLRPPERLEPLGLHGARRRDPRRDFLASFRWRRQHEIGRADGGHFDVEVDAVEERPRQPRLIVGDAARIGAALAGEARVIGAAAAARVHRGDELKARRIGDAVVGAGDRDLAGFDRLPERIEHLRLEFGKLVEEEHAAMRKRNLAGLRAQAAADHRGHARGMMRIAERPLVGERAVLDRARDRGDHRNLEQLRGRQRRQDRGQARGEHRLSRTRRPDHQHVEYVETQSYIGATMTKAYSYVRFSTPEQGSGDSLRRQTEAARRYATQHGLELDETLTFTDPGLSAYRGRNAKEGGALAAFLTAVEMGTVPKGSYLLVESLDRISRQTVRKAVRTMEDIVEAGVNLVDLSDSGRLYNTETLDNDGMAFLMMAVRFIRAYEESAIKGRRVRAARSAARAEVRKGKRKVFTARSPAWLKVKKDRSGFEPIPERAKVIRRIFKMLADGRGKHAIAETLNREQVPTWNGGKFWHRSYIEKIANNPAVNGTFIPYVTEHVEGQKKRKAQSPIPKYFPAVVEKSLYRRVRSLSTDAVSPLRGRHAVSGHIQNVLGGLAKCPKCGSTMTRVTKGSRKKAGKPYLVCSKAKAGAGCDYHAVKLDAVEDALQRNAGWLANQCPTPGKEGAGLDARIETKALEVEQLGEEIERLIQTVRLEGGSTEIAKTIRELEADRERAERERNQLLDRRATVFPAFLDKRIQALEEALEAEPFDSAKANLLLREFFSSATVDYQTGYIELEWKQGGETSVLFMWPDKKGNRKKRHPRTTHFKSVMQKKKEAS